MSHEMAPSALLTHWEVSYQRTNQEIEWDILLKPLLFGPVCVLDNMLLDNPGLIEAVRKPQVRSFLEKYAQRGLVRLWHREIYGSSYPVRDLEDLLMIWLSRSDPDAVRTVGLVCLETTDTRDINTLGVVATDQLLEGYRNQQLRELIQGFGKKAKKEERVAEFKDFMVKHGPPGFVEALDAYRNIFFNKSPYSREQWSKYPPSLQSRVLRAFGVKNPNPLIERCVSDGISLAEELNKSNSYREPPRYAGLPWRDFLGSAQLKGSPEERFFSCLAQLTDCTWSTLCARAIGVRPTSPQIGRYLPQLVTEAYVCGIPEANNHRIMWDYLQDP